MSNLTIKPLFPVVSVSLGNAVKETTKTDEKGKVTVTKTNAYYFGVFTVKTPNKMFLLTSVDGDNITIPKLVELLKLPSISLTGANFEIDLPKAVLTTLTEWFNAPLNEQDGISPYMLNAWGMIDNSLFSDTIQRVLAPSLAANDLSLESIDSGKVMRHIHLTRATALGMNGDHTSLADRISNYLTVLSTDNKRLSDSQTVKYPAIKPSNTDVKDEHTTSNNRVNDTSENTLKDDTKFDDIKQDVNPNNAIPVNLLAAKFELSPDAMSKTDLLTFAKDNLVEHVTKSSEKQAIIEAINDKLATVA